MKEDLFITTAYGHRFYFLDMESSVIQIKDIAHSLARQCRYCGHTRTPDAIYSVAQHSILCALYVQTLPVATKMPELVLAALLHDAAEAYLGDMTGPLKTLFPEFKKLELQLDRVIEKQFGLSYGIFEHPVVKAADLSIRRDEANTFCYGAENLCQVTDGGNNGIQALGIHDLHAWNVKYCEDRFLALYKDLRKQLRTFTST
jgi:5'-deoxynucleotidase YfbR-like HD superfamily hydrolase